MKRLDGTGPTGEDQERRLEGILGRLAVPEDSSADLEDHRSMALDQGSECRLCPRASRHELGQQEPVTVTRDRPFRAESLDLPQHRSPSIARHFPGSADISASLELPQENMPAGVCHNTGFPGKWRA